MSKRFTVGAVATATVLALTVTGPVSSASAEQTAATETFTVVAKEGVSADDAIAAIRAAGGTVVSRTDAVGIYQVTSSRSDFAARATAAAALVGAAQQKAIGYKPKLDRIEQEHLLAAAGKKPEKGNPGKGNPGNGPKNPGNKMDPLDDKLWGLEMIRADQSRRIESGDRRVKVGILDTGVDASHPDIAPNFDWSLSRNFAPDIPEVDGPCEVPSCVDPVGTDDNGHGTHVAGTIGAAANGFGISGVAPNVSLVQLKGGQDSGYFFLEPVVRSLVHAADSGIDVVNMSFYVDPWMFNCQANPADSPEDQAAQRATITAMQRALEYAHRKGVTLVASLGNNHDDLGNPRVDTGSPNFGDTAPYPRTIDNATCFKMPVEGPHVLGVSSLGPSYKKSDFSDYGLEQISVAAPGGWYRDGFGTDSYRTDANMILSTYPKHVLQEEGTVDADGNIVPGAETFVFKECKPNGECGYYTYLQGTSMAAPHVSGVTALIVSRFGKKDRQGGFGLDPDLVEQHLYRTAAKRACPEPRLQQYRDEGRDETFDAYCAGGRDFNGFYGHGVVDAYAAVKTPLKSKP